MSHQLKSPTKVASVQIWFVDLPFPEHRCPIKHSQTASQTRALATTPLELSLEAEILAVCYSQLSPLYPIPINTHSERISLSCLLLLKYLYSSVLAIIMFTAALPSQCTFDAILNRAVAHEDSCRWWLLFKSSVTPTKLEKTNKYTAYDTGFTLQQVIDQEMWHEPEARTLLQWV